MSDIIIGRNAVIEAFKSGSGIEKVYLLSTLRGEYEVQMRHLCKEHNVPLAKVPEPKLNDLTKSRTHQGVVALISPISYVDYRDIVAQAFDAGRQPLLLILDGITDIRNIGGIARSAFYFSCDALIIAGSFAGRINEEAIKSSAGALLRIPVCRDSSLFNLVADLQALGIKVVASSLSKNAILPHESVMNEPMAIIVGSEDKGINPKLLEIVDEVVKIPSIADFDSLNVSVASGVLLYECARQRNIQG